jgi:hypothetical protein
VQEWVVHAAQDPAVDVDLDEVGQREQQVRGACRGGGEECTRIDAGAHRQPDLGVVPGGRRGLLRTGWPHEAQHGELAAAARELGGRPGQLADGLRGRQGGERGAAARSDHPGFVGHPEHGREADAEPAHRARVVPLGRGAQGRERRNPGRVERDAGVGHAQLAVDEEDAQTSGDPGRAGGVRGVLRELDEPRIGVPAEAQVFLGVGVFAEPRGRVRPGREGGRAQGRGAEGVGHAREPADSRSTPSS